MQVHWKEPVEPHWYYKLAETIYQFYENNSHLTVQALYKLKAQSKFTFHYLPEIDLYGFPAAGEKRELDIACVLDGKIILGECKTEALRPKDAAKFETLLKMIGKRPDRIVFATTLPSVTDAFMSRISGLSHSEMLTFGDLYESRHKIWI
jgi:hypothetical protein